MTVKPLGEWIFTNHLDDSSWVAMEGKTLRAAENLETVAMFASSGRPVMVLHVSKASLASPPRVVVDLLPVVSPGRSALGSRWVRVGFACSRENKFSGYPPNGQNKSD